MKIKVEVEEIEKLSKFEASSWAIWSKEFNQKTALENYPDQLYKFIVNRRYLLKKDVIFLGLNRSKNKERYINGIFTNFHVPGHPGDELLKEIISNLTRLSGGYMTDLSLQIESNSSNVKNISALDFTRLKRQLNILNTQNTFLICFGKDVYQELRNAFSIQSEISTKFLDLKAFVTDLEERRVFVFKVIHYSYASRFNKIERLRKQLHEIDNFIEKQPAS